jgi:hypothetical protein
MKNEQPFELYAINNPGDDGIEPLKAILPKDGSRGFVVGEDWEIEYLHDLLSLYLENKQVTGTIPDYHEQLGTHWMTSGDAEKESGVQSRTIRYAAAHGFIQGAAKAGRDWRFPRRTFLHWLRNRPKPGRK